MKRLLAAAAFTLAADPALAQERRLEAVCGDLFGARQTAIRLLKEGWPGNTVVQDALNRPEWRNASMPDRKMLMDLFQELFNDPAKPSSDVIRDCMRRAEAAPKGG
ncbi:MAG: hypothetical protein ACREVS_08050 [Burkholderiales bacterium]